jgi:hypothetical protein
MKKSSAGFVAFFVAASVTLAAVLGRHSEVAAVPSADRAIAHAEAWLAPRAEYVTVERARASLVSSADEFLATTTFRLGALGPNGFERPVWVVTLGATWPGESSRRALRYVIEAETGRFLVFSIPLPDRPGLRRLSNLTTG